MRKTLVLSLLFLSLLLTRQLNAACRELDVARSWLQPAYAAEPDVTLEFFGHNFFQITSAKGTKIITDPVSPGFYPTPNVSPHAITVGREHPNHNFVEIAKNGPVVLRGLGNYGAEWNKVSTTVKDILVYTVPIYQQQYGNALKGAAFVFDLGTICV
ncbi:MAG: MBL fold metallo-hydrolase, partial [Candidatus Binatia bacterium]